MNKQETITHLKELLSGARMNLSFTTKMSYPLNTHDGTKYLEMIPDCKKDIECLESAIKLLEGDAE